MLSATIKLKTVERTDEMFFPAVKNLKDLHKATFDYLFFTMNIKERSNNFTVSIEVKPVEDVKARI